MCHPTERTYLAQHGVENKWVFVVISRPDLQLERFDYELANPYRRALVRTTLFPEAVPDARTRFTAFIGGAYHRGSR